MKFPGGGGSSGLVGPEFGSRLHAPMVSGLGTVGDVVPAMSYYRSPTKLRKDNVFS